MISPFVLRQLLRAEVEVTAKRWEAWLFLVAYVTVLLLVVVPTGPIGSSTGGMRSRSWEELWVRGALYGGQVGLIISPTLLAVLLGAEFTWGTVRQRVAEGWGRVRLFYAKAIVSLLLATVFLLATVIVVVTYGLTIAPSGTGLTTAAAGHLARLLFCLCLVNLLGLSLTMLIRNGAAALGIWLFYAAWLENVIGTVLPDSRVGMVAQALLPVASIVGFLNPRLAVEPYEGMGFHPGVLPGCIATVVLVLLAARSFTLRDL